MSYPGNPSLSPDVQEKARATFEQTLNLAAQGREQEAQAGCDFILGLDPLFQPARTLHDRLRSAERPIRIDDLRAPPPAPLEVDAAAISAAAPAAPAPPQSSSPAAGLGAVLHDLLSKGNYQQVLQIAGSQAQAIAHDPQLQAMVAQARTALGAGAAPAAEAPAASSPQAPSLAAPMATPQPPAAAPMAAPQAPAAAPVPPQAPAAAPATPQAAPASTPTPQQPAAAPQAPSGDDLLDLQRMSLSLVTEHEDPLSEVQAEPQLDSLNVGDDSDLLSLDNDLDALDLDEQALPDLDESLVANPAAETPGVSPAPLEASLAAAPEPQVPDAGAPLLDFAAPAQEVGAPGAPTPPPEIGAPAAAPAAAAPIGPIPGMPSADPAAGVAGPGEPGVAFDASGDPDEDGQQRIAQLLEEGQGIFETGDYQGAIDVWSRIFLIDVSNGEASQRIEEARKKKAELERYVEEVFHEGVRHIENASLEEAKDSFRRVLETDPNHSLAREYLEQLEAGKVPTVAARASEAGEFDDLVDAAGAMGEVGGSPSMEAAVQRDRVVVVKKLDKRLIALAAVVAIVVIVGGGWLFFNKDKLFPNTSQPAPTSRPRIDPIARATKLYELGDPERAIESLRQLPADDPAYEEALALIKQWEASDAAADPVDTGPSPELLRRRNLLLAAARKAQQERRFLLALHYYDRADKILALEAADLALKLNCDAELLPLEEEIDLVRNREYAEVLPGLWRRRAESPGNHDIDRLMTLAYYNLALIDLQRNNAEGAATKLKDALEIAPDDDDLQRLHLFAKTYAKRRQDLLYLIYVKYLPSRDL